MKLKKAYLLLFSVLSISCIYAQEIKHPTAKFSFNNGNDYDEVSPQHKAKLVGTNFVNDRFGNENSAVYIAANIYSYINLGNYSAIKPKAGTISLWAKMESTVLSGKGALWNPILLTKCNDLDDFNEAYAIHYLFMTKRLSFLMTKDSTREGIVTSLDTIRKNVWHHLAISYDYDYASFYIDGQLQRRLPKKFETKFLKTDSVMLGSSASKKNVRVFDGVVDDVVFYDTVLSEDEIVDLYNAPNPNEKQLIVKWFLICAGFVLIIVLIYFLIRYRLSLTLEKEKKTLELYNIVLETELRVNRALMNPHFVFNSLNTLQNFILKNENDRANNYLVKFSKLMRNILESNMSNSISLEFEIELINRYLEIENLRFEENIQYSILLDESVVPSNLNIPIMMLQPFVENAIWHGLIKKHGEKTLKISFSVIEDKYLQCIIEDNGLGRDRKVKDGVGKKSLATSFVMQRLDLLNKIYNLNCHLYIEDKPDNEGTIINITLPLLKKPA